MKQNYYKKLIGTIIIVSIIIALFFAQVSNDLVSKNFIYYVINSIFMTTGVWLGCVAIVTLLWKKYPWERHPIKHLVIEFITITVYVFAFGYLRIYLGHWLNIPNEFNEDTMPKLGDFTIMLLITYLITAIHEAIFFYRQWVINFSKSARLEKDNIEAKYAALKSQINPHFLFNSLNNLSLIADKNKEAVSYIDNLSDVMRYILKSNENELVLVRDETQLLHKYLELQKSRFQDNLIIKMQIDESYYHYQVPPLSVQMLVENAIKHNIISKEKPLTITITAKKESILIENNLQKKQGVQGTEQGLKNITERYAFFSSRKVEIKESKNAFSVTLPLLTVSL